MITLFKGSYNSCKAYIKDVQRFEKRKLYLNYWCKKDNIYCVQII